MEIVDKKQLHKHETEKIQISTTDCYREPLLI